MKSLKENKEEKKHPLEIELHKKNRIKRQHSIFKYNVIYITCPYFIISSLSGLTPQIKSLQMFLLHRKRTAVNVSHSIKDT